MKLTLVAKDWPSGCLLKHCPAIYESDRGSFVVQGAIVRPADVPAELDIPEDESIVEIPRAVMESLVAHLR